MPWEVAKQAMKEGHSIRLPSWKSSLVMYMTLEGRLIWEDNFISAPISAHYSERDFSSFNDWELVK